MYNKVETYKMLCLSLIKGDKLSWTVAHKKASKCQQHCYGENTKCVRR